MEFNDETLSTSNVPRKMICPVTILDYDKIEIDYPDIGKRVLSAKIENADWAVGGAKRY